METVAVHLRWTTARAAPAGEQARVAVMPCKRRARGRNAVPSRTAAGTHSGAGTTPPPKHEGKAGAKKNRQVVTLGRERRAGARRQVRGG